MNSIGLALKLRPDCYEEYKRRHDELWPELAEILRANGISMVIYRLEDFLFVHETAPSEESWTRLNEHPVTTRAGNKYMPEVLERMET
ncbi:MAG: L-rhamnose mutarotase [Acidobacteria bacterium]|nr:L-rhamnose mutarotase [Acidobacteriota bacterium]MCI0723621.1 L-rhamnose mutarotase [Acidobacteriota bacterium]